MNAKIDDLNAQRAYTTLRASGARGLELADILEARRTRVRVSNKIIGGFTLNFINTIFVQPLRADADKWDYWFWVSILAHEACHIEQRYWVDSVEQEIRAYTTQAHVGDDLGIDLVNLKNAFVNLDPTLAEHRERARAALLTMFEGEPAAFVYASLPLSQPTGIHAFVPALRQLGGVLRAARVPRR